MEIAKFLEEGKNYIKINDPVQASEKLYKAAEEAIKSLSESYAPEIFAETQRKGRWTSPLLFEAADKIADKIGKEVIYYWNIAWTLHVEGFYEARLNVNYIARRVDDIDKLVKLAEQRKK